MPRRSIPWLLALIGALCPAREPARCLPCHEQQVRGYAETAMGRSAGPAAGLPAGEFRHAPSGVQYVVETGRSGMVHRLISGARRQAHSVPWFIGSGNEGRSFLIAIGDSLFQSPVSWYTRRNRYDLSPGYEHDRIPGFSRPVSSDCLFCHTGQVKPKPGTQNRYLDPAVAEAAITCARCHGDSARHLAAPSKANIINPVRLSVAARDSVCEQCHLGGEARIPNPDRAFFDFKPGMKLEEVFSVYVRGEGEKPERFRVVSHVEQLALSLCAIAGGEKLWCGSCHNPHAKPAGAASWYRSRCLACHSGGLPADHDAAAADCRGCHMPRCTAWDGGHTAFTDHRITRRPGETPQSQGEKLRAWRSPPAGYETRNLGLAYISAGERNDSVWRLNEGFRLLAGARPRLGTDPAADTALGLILLRKQAPAEAVRLFARASSAQPADSRSHLNLAVAQHAAGDTEAAIRAAQKAIELERLLEEATALLAEIYNSRGDRGNREAVLRRYQQLVSGRRLP